MLRNGARWCEMVKDAAKWCEIVQDGAGWCKTQKLAFLPLFPTQVGSCSAQLMAKDGQV